MFCFNVEKAINNYNISLSGNINVLTIAGESRLEDGRDLF